jgi:hypothetical protein
MSSDDDDDIYLNNDSDEEVNSDYDEVEENDDKYEAEFNAHERVFFGSDLIGTTAKTKMEQATQDPLERFRRNVNAIAKNMSNFGYVIQKDSIQQMIEKANKLEVIEYKNPTAYILGYLVLDNGKISNELFTKVVTQILPHVTEKDSILKPDIIRYAVLWQNL